MHLSIFSLSFFPILTFYLSGSLSRFSLSDLYKRIYIRGSVLQVQTPAPTHGRPQGVGKNRRSPPSGKSKICVFAIWVAFLLPFLHMGAFLLRFPLRGGGGGLFHHMIEGLFSYFFLHLFFFSVFKGGVFSGCPPPLPTKITASAHAPTQGRKSMFKHGGDNIGDKYISRLLRGHGGMPPEKIFLNDAIWCVLVYIWIRFCL